MREDNGSKKLMRSALLKFGIGIGILGLFLFICAGDIRYWNAWLFLAVFATCIFLLGAYLYKRDKDLLRKRLNSKEKEREQDVYTYATGLSFFLIFILCGMDYRFGWSSVPVGLVLAALAIMLSGFALFVITLMQNRFASRIVEVQDRQKVIDTGVYSVVRHPMYTAALTMFLASPVILGSFYSLIPVSVFLTGIVFRIRNEEKVLVEGLEGYSDYIQKVRYRIIPYIW